jgi:5-formyltetrahydrofolate cyclo-ligase
MSRTRALRQQKEHLRQRFLARRQGLDEIEARRASAAACRRLSELSALQRSRHIAGYAARGAEVGVRTFLEQAKTQGVQISLPRVTGPGRMEFCMVNDWDELSPGAFGIDEPTGPAVDHSSIQVFLVPGLAFDRRGGRLGFGMGYYDRALPPVGEALAIGVCHHWQLVDQELPTESHDRPMDLIVSDQITHLVDTEYGGEE